LRGDPIKSETYFAAEKGGHKYASDLIRQVHGLNNGVYLDDNLKNSSNTNFCMGVAGYPEKQREAPNMNSDIHFLKKKIECGAEYIVTQMFFDNQKYFDFVKLCRDNDINVPIIPGLKPLSTAKHLNILPHRFHLNQPSELVNGIYEAEYLDA
jgi:methylenetetrahydrofolate reductase (NADPH)